MDTTAIELVEEEEEVQIPPDLFVDDISMYNINDGLEEDASLSAEILINEICLDPMIDNDFVEEIIVDSKPLTAPPSQFTHSDQRYFHCKNYNFINSIKRLSPLSGLASGQACWLSVTI